MLDLNKIFNFYYGWWKNIDKFIFFLILLLFGLGLFFSLVSTSIIASDKLNTNTYYFFIKHFLFIRFYFSYNDYLCSRIYEILGNRTFKKF